METLKTIIVDNNSFFREDLKLILECEFCTKVIATIENEDELFYLSNQNVDIVFVNLTVSRKNEFKTIKRFLWEFPEKKVIGINTFFSEDNYLHQLIEVGFKGCIDGNNIYNELDDAIAKVINGGMYFSKKVLDGF